MNSDSIDWWSLGGGGRGGDAHERHDTVAILLHFRCVSQQVRVSNCPIDSIIFYSFRNWILSADVSNRRKTMEGYGVLYSIELKSLNGHIWSLESRSISSWITILFLVCARPSNSIRRWTNASRAQKLCRTRTRLANDPSYSFNEQETICLNRIARAHSVCYLKYPV